VGGVAVKRRVHVSRTARARAGWVLGWLVTCAGIYLTLGLGAALIIAGLVIAGSFLGLYDVDELDTSGEVRRR
jgi:hypothetical protein